MKNRYHLIAWILGVAGAGGCVAETAERDGQDENAAGPSIAGPCSRADDDAEFSRCNVPAPKSSEDASVLRVVERTTRQTAGASNVLADPVIIK